MVYAVVAIVFSNWVAKIFCRPFMVIQEIIDRFMRSETLAEKEFDCQNFITVEFQQLQLFLRQAFVVLQGKHAAEKALYNLATQVSHDIRSPLATLNIVLKNLTELPEEKRALLQNVACSIRDIANNLLAQYKTSKPHTTQNNLRPELIATLVSALISEKRIQFTEKDLRLQEEIHADARNCLVNLDAPLFKRVLSNLINNAVEALRAQGEVKIVLEKNKRSVILKIIDNGKGIPADILPKIHEGGISVGKEQGYGLGISNAIYCIKQWNGSHDIQSTVDKGTVFTIELPIAKEILNSKF